MEICSAVLPERNCDVKYIYTIAILSDEQMLAGVNENYDDTIGVISINRIKFKI